MALNETWALGPCPKLKDADADVERNRAMRWIVALFSLGIVLGVSYYIPHALWGLLGFEENSPKLAIAVFIATFLIARMYPTFLVLVPEYSMVVTQSVLFKTGYIVYGPNLHVRFPWERIGEWSNFSLRIITMRFVEEVPTKTAKAIAMFAYQFKIYLPNGSLFVGVDETTIDSGVIAVIRSFVSQKLSSQAFDDAKNDIDGLNGELEERFGFINTDTDSSFGSGNVCPRYAIATVSLKCEGIDLDPDTQKSRDLKDRGEQTLAAVASYYGKTVDEITNLPATAYQEMLETVLAAEGVSGIRVQALRGSASAGIAAAIGNVATGRNDEDQS